MEKKCKQVNPNNPSWIEDPQRSTEAHCIAFGISNLIQLAGMCLHIIFNGTYHSLVSMIIFILFFFSCCSFPFYFVSLFFFFVLFCSVVVVCADILTTCGQLSEMEKGTERKIERHTLNVIVCVFLSKLYKFRVYSKHLCLDRTEYVFSLPFRFMVYVFRNHFRHFARHRQHQRLFTVSHTQTQEREKKNLIRITSDD